MASPNRIQTAQDEQEERRRLLAIAIGDFEIFCRSLVTIAPKEKARDPRPTRLNWNPPQRRYCLSRTSRDVILKARQQGFSTVELARDVWKFLQRGERVLVICQTDKDNTYLRMFTDGVNRMFAGLQRAGIKLDFGVNALGSWSLPDRDSFLRITEAGASEAAAVKKGRGGTYSRLHSTECGFYEFPEAALNASLEGVPNLPNTEIVFESTANGSGTWFHQFWLAALNGESGYAPHFFPWYEHPDYQTRLDPGEVIEPRNAREQELVDKHDISLAQLKWWRAKVQLKGIMLVDQEYPGDPIRAFLASGRTFFDKEATDRHIALIREPIAKERGGNLYVWKRPERGTKYVIVADPSEGAGGDPGAAVIRERETGAYCGTLHGQFPTWEFGRLLSEVGLEYNTALVVVERNNHGAAVLQSLERGDRENGRDPYPNIYVHTDEKLGWNNTETTRAVALEALEKAHRDGSWSSPDARTISEIKSFTINKRGKAQAESGAHDDLVLAEAIMNDVLARPAAPHHTPPPLATNDFEGSALG